jgi:hypothetical protein
LLILVHNSPTALEPYRHPNLGVLSSPRRFYKKDEGIEKWPWAADNDAFSAWDETRFRKMLDGIRELQGCLFVTAPDVVGDSLRTTYQFHQWRAEMDELPVGYVSQDGLLDENIPWDEISSFFVGGSTEWKMCDQAAEQVREAKRRGKWVHMGRVNSLQRIRYAKSIGCDSIDGTSLSWWKDVYIRKFADHAAAPAQMMLGDQ